jgi:hypothetical protein
VSRSPACSLGSNLKQAELNSSASAGNQQLKEPYQSTYFSATHGHVQRRNRYKIMLALIHIVCSTLRLLSNIP